MKPALTTLIAQRIQQEFKDFELAIPLGLRTIIDDDLYYAIAVIITGSNAFALGFIIGLAL